MPQHLIGRGIQIGINDKLFLRILSFFTIPIRILGGMVNIGKVNLDLTRNKVKLPALGMISG